MLIKLLCLLSIFSFLSASNVEVGSLVMDSDLSVSAQMDKDLSASEVENEHCNDCRDDAHVLQITLLVMSMRFLNSIHGPFLNLGGSFLVIINFLS